MVVFVTGYKYTYILMHRHQSDRLSYSALCETLQLKSSSSTDCFCFLSSPSFGTSEPILEGSLQM